MRSLSHVRLLVAPWTAVHQAPPSMGFSRQEYWSGVPLPSPLRSPFIYNWLFNVFLGSRIWERQCECTYTCFPHQMRPAVSAISCSAAQLKVKALWVHEWVWISTLPVACCMTIIKLHVSLSLMFWVLTSFSVELRWASCASQFCCMDWMRSNMSDALHSTRATGSAQMDSQYH